MNKIPVGVLGATGTVGQRFVQLLADHPWFEVVAVTGSDRTVGRPYGEGVNWLMPGRVPARAAELIVQPTTPNLDIPGRPPVDERLDREQAAAAGAHHLAAGIRKGIGARIGEAGRVAVEVVATVVGTQRGRDEPFVLAATRPTSALTSPVPQLTASLTPTTVKGAGVDVSTLNIIGLGGTAVAQEVGTSERSEHSLIRNGGQDGLASQFMAEGKSVTGSP